MGDTPKEKPQDDETEQAADPDDSTWEQDQKERGYYYDDSHGYEIYKDQEDEEED